MASIDLTTVIFLMLTILVLIIATAALVGIAYFLSLRLGWMPRAEDDQPHSSKRSANQAVLTGAMYDPVYITISKFDFEAIEFVQFNRSHFVPKLLSDMQGGNYHSHTYALIANGSFDWKGQAKNKKTNIVQFPIREKPDAELAMAGIQQGVAFG